MSAHTPGPWMRDTYGNVIAANGRRVCFRNVVVTLAGSMKCIEEADKNTTLISAAPELLEALQGMLSAWNMVCDTQGWERDHIQQQKDVVAAIAKATGEQK